MDMFGKVAEQILLFFLCAFALVGFLVGFVLGALIF